MKGVSSSAVAKDTCTCCFNGDDLKGLAVTTCGGVVDICEGEENINKKSIKFLRVKRSKGAYNHRIQH